MEFVCTKKPLFIILWQLHGQKAYRNFHEKVFEIIEFESFETIETSKGLQHKVHKRISEGVVLVTGPFYGVKHAFITCLTHNN